jgi:hypothetical protein
MGALILPCDSHPLLLAKRFSPGVKRLKIPLKSYAPEQNLLLYQNNMTRPIGGWFLNIAPSAPSVPNTYIYETIVSFNIK